MSVEDGWATPPDDDSERHDLDHTLTRYRKMKHVLAELDAVAEEEHVGLCLVAAEEPDSVDEALDEARWKRAMHAELAAIRDNATWELATLPPGHGAIGLKWVYKIKRDATGNTVKHKARLVAKGYT